ncbi:HAD-IB family hydrolase [Nocardia jinanensis]|uniref:L-3-phosphoserine phosphatase n=1 Tax=Nocardia jinanensis TaxID=382504 RepID=A0A917VXA9_9NOCA|nr:HAD-IB family hydrolase [Nocardia jinanensis]GGL29356.1 L-3-phosphoserine phosphatase [Nocardia jinanensis]
MKGARPPAYSVESELRRIRIGPDGPRIAAFFDFDGTIIEGITPVRSGLSGLHGANTAAPLLSGLTGRKSDAHRRSVQRLVSESWRGRAVGDLEEAEEQLFQKHIARNLYPEAWELVRAHQRAGHTVVLATSATRFQVRRLAAELGIEHTLCTEPIVSDERITGEIAGELVWGRYKAELVKEFAVAHDIDLEKSFGYSNGGVDTPMLRLTGNPTAVNPDRALTRAATGPGWRVLRFERRRPGPYRIGRTLIGALAMVVAACAGFLCAPAGDRRTAIDRMYRWVSTAVLRGAGLRIRVTDADKARVIRPAVFVFNHQSQIDSMIIPYILRESFTPVVTIKVKHYPVFGALLRFVGTLFIDRSTPGGAKEALNSLVVQLRTGRSVAIAPEGRISPTPRLQDFKQGAFRLAAQAGVPIVPIVIRDAGRAMWRKALTIRPGTIDVMILDPIDTCSWEPEDLGTQIAAVRRLYLDTLEQWPDATCEAPSSERENQRARVAQDLSARLPHGE